MYCFLTGTKLKTRFYLIWSELFKKIDILDWFHSLVQSRDGTGYPKLRPFRPKLNPRNFPTPKTQIFPLLIPLNYPRPERRTFFRHDTWSDFFLDPSHPLYKTYGFLINFIQIELFIASLLMFLVITGFKARQASLLLALWLLFINFNLNAWWKLPKESPYKEFAKFDFFQTFSVIGGLLLIFVHGPGNYSIDALTKKDTWWTFIFDEEIAGLKII